MPSAPFSNCAFHSQLPGGPKGSELTVVKFGVWGPNHTISCPSEAQSEVHVIEGDCKLDFIETADLKE